MLHQSDEAFAFGEHRQLGEVTGIVCPGPARPTWLRPAPAGQGTYPTAATVPNVLGT